MLEQEIAGQTITEWLSLLVVWVLISSALVLLNRVFRSRFVKLAERTANRIDDVIAALLKRTRLYFLIGLGLYFALRILAMEGDGAMWVGRVVFVLLMLQVGFWLNSLISLWIDRYKQEKLETDAAAVTTMQALGFVGRLAVWFLILLFVLNNFGIEVTALVATAGVGGIAIALAVQNILGDLFASLSIVLDKPFVVGDFLIIGGDFLGSVEHIGLKTTRLRSLGGEQLVFSNSDLLSARIRNYKRMYERRVVFGVGVTYQTPHHLLQQIPQILRESVEAQDQVRFDRAHWKAYGDFALTFEIVYYVLSPEYNLYMDVQQEINLAIHRRFEELGIEFAYPTQTVFLERVGENGAQEIVN